MGMGHPHPAMSMMSGMPAAAGLEERVPGAVLPSGLASESQDIQTRMLE